MADDSNWTWDDVSFDDDVLKIKEITSSPVALNPGGEVEFTIRAQLSAPLEEGAYLDVVVKLGLIKLMQKTFDLAYELRKLGYKIPIPAGDVEFVQRVSLPREIPRAKFKISARGYTHKDDELLCVDVAVNFMPNL